MVVVLQEVIYNWNLVSNGENFNLDAITTQLFICEILFQRGLPFVEQINLSNVI